MDDDDYEDFLQLAAVLRVMILSVGTLLLMMPDERKSPLYDQRLIWNQYSSRHHQRGTFARRLRMHKDSFDKLVQLLEADLLVDEVSADLRGGAILPEICVYCTLRYLAGGSYLLDITDVAGISQASFYRVVWKTVTAIAKSPALQLRFPRTTEEISAAVAGLAGISTEQAIHNCVGVVDGYLLRCKVPSKKEAKNVRSFFSGHYQCYGVNIQAAADHHCRFIHFS